MSDPVHGSREAPIGAGRVRIAEIRALAPGLGLGAAVCLFLAYAWLVDAPGAVSKELAPAYFAVDRAFVLALKVLAGLFAVAALAAATGARAAALFAAAVECLLGLLLLGMAVEGWREGALDGVFDPFLILIAALGAYSIYTGYGAWRLYAS